MDKSELSKLIKKKIIEKGFHAVGITRAQKLIDFEDKLDQWITDGFQAEMQYMERNREKRFDASKLVAGARSVIVMLASYRPKEIINPNHPQIAKYAYGLDYHVILKQKMTEVWNELKQFAPELEGRMFTDSAPLYERGYAVNAGLGWLGKNSCLIHPKLGSWVFICEMVINIDLEYDRLFENNHCGKCTRCMDACPTKAIVKPGVIDSRKCIAYLTIEHKGEIQNHLVQKFTNQLFGCDICQDVCPWNQKNQGIELFEEFRLDQELDKSLEEWKRLDQIKFTELYGNSAFSRCGWEGFRRNLKVISDSGKLQN